MDVVTYALCKKLVADATKKAGKVFNIKGELPSVDDLPMTGNEGGDTYLIGPKTDGTYDEYYWIESKSKWDYMGNTNVDLADYLKKEDAAKTYAPLERVEELEENEELIYLFDEEEEP